MARTLIPSGESQSAAALRVHLVLFVTAVLFSINYIVSKLAMQDFGPLPFAWLRIAGAWLLLSLMVQSAPLNRPLRRHELWRCLGYSVLGVVINQLMFLGGLARTTAHEAAILITTIPIFVLLIAAAMGMERITRWKAGGIALACIGALIIVVTADAVVQQSSLRGNAMIVINCLSYSTYLVLSRSLYRTAPAARVLRAMFGYGIILALPFTAVPLLNLEWRSVPPLSWFWLGVIVAGPTVGAYLLSGWALARAESSTVAVYTYLQPVLASIMAALILHERMRSAVLLGGLLILAGVVLASRRSIETAV